MGKARVTPHRPARDGAHAKELSQSKQENKQLRREVNRLRKLVEKYAPGAANEEEPETLGNSSESQEPVSNNPQSPVTASGGKGGGSNGSCSACGHQTVMLETPTGKKVWVCKNCKARTIQQG